MLDSIIRTDLRTHQSNDFSVVRHSNLEVRADRPEHLNDMVHLPDIEILYTKHGVFMEVVTERDGEAIGSARTIRNAKLAS